MDRIFDKNDDNSGVPAVTNGRSLVRTVQDLLSTKGGAFFVVGSLLRATGE